MRFIAPARAELDISIFRHPVFSSLAEQHLQLCLTESWPDVALLNKLWCTPKSSLSAVYQFVAQEILNDKLHYEQRIAELGAIATRTENWHDLFNAFIWLRFPAIKAALNARQCQDIAQVGVKQRTRSQCALTHFDEAGAVIRLSDSSLLAHWDAHDWPAFFAAWQPAYEAGTVQLWLFGHSIFEHALNPDIALVAKALVFIHPETMNDAAMDAFLAERISHQQCLMDPQELRPIPLSGIAHWHALYGQADFYQKVPCFRSKRPGKLYPEPLHLQ
jgi:Protein of unknown function (DUF3025)